MLARAVGLAVSCSRALQQQGDRALSGGLAETASRQLPELWRGAAESWRARPGARTFATAAVQAAPEEAPQEELVVDESAAAVRPWVHATSRDGGIAEPGRT